MLLDFFTILLMGQIAAVKRLHGEDAVDGLSCCSINNWGHINDRAEYDQKAVIFL
jgi:hypothetical protein